MSNAERYPFIPIESARGEAGLQPRLPLTRGIARGKITVQSMRQWVSGVPVQSPVVRFTSIKAVELTAYRRRRRRQG